MASAGANLGWLDAAVMPAPLAITALALQGVKPASVALMGPSAPCAKGLAGNVPAGPAPLASAVTTVSVASGASPTAGRVSAMGVQMNAMPTQALAWAAGITRGASTVRGALLVFMGTHG